MRRGKNRFPKPRGDLALENQREGRASNSEMEEKRSDRRNLVYVLYVGRDNSECMLCLAGEDHEESDARCYLLRV